MRAANSLIALGLLVRLPHQATEHPPAKRAIAEHFVAGTGLCHDQAGDPFGIEIGLRDAQAVGKALWQNVVEGSYRRRCILSARGVSAEFGAQPRFTASCDFGLEAGGGGAHDVALALAQCITGLDRGRADLKEVGDRLVIQSLRRARQQLEGERAELPRAGGVQHRFPPCRDLLRHYVRDGYRNSTEGLPEASAGGVKSGRKNGRRAMNDAMPMPVIDPELVAAGKLLQERGLVAPDRTVAPLSEVRAAVDRIGAFLGEGSVPLRHERDLMLPGPHGQVPCRLYLPDNAEKPPVIVYAHGGGFMQGSLDSWDAMLRELVRQSGVAALSVDYKLSPEHRFPKAFDETVAMIRLVAREGAGLGVDPARIAVGGDSAGGNLALGRGPRLARRRRDAHSATCC